MRDVAEEAGVSLGTTYRYFASKDHLLAAAWTDWARRLSDRVRAEMTRDASRAGHRHGRRSVLMRPDLHPPRASRLSAESELRAARGTGRGIVGSVCGRGAVR
ncbi:TetR/AcrR family transcriptional regulator [Frankia gtarii]|uniref:TetR/AcrR family transcriptional regulator n=1 Tax=Frankia gtarii TaxID=2950102 RepID=UPI0021BF0C04|nr:TetR/AcrR family transcriptional regulator [Frankia gtarii]